MNDALRQTTILINTNFEINVFQLNNKKMSHMISELFYTSVYGHGRLKNISM